MEKKFPELNEKQLQTLRNLLLNQGDRGESDDGDSTNNQVSIIVETIEIIARSFCKLCFEL